MKRHFCIDPLTILLSHQAVPYISQQNCAHDYMHFDMCITWQQYHAKFLIVESCFETKARKNCTELCFCFFSFIPKQKKRSIGNDNKCPITVRCTESKIGQKCPEDQECYAKTLRCSIIAVKLQCMIVLVQLNVMFQECNAIYNFDSSSMSK